MQHQTRPSTQIDITSHGILDNETYGMHFQSDVNMGFFLRMLSKWSMLYDGNMARHDILLIWMLGYIYGCL